jgi:hypothetical protein
MQPGFSGSSSAKGEIRFAQSVHLGWFDLIMNEAKNVGAPR